MQTLIITAHPSAHGFTHQIAMTYHASVVARGATAEVIDLYDSAYRQDFLRFEDVKAWPEDPVREVMQAKISAADEIVLVFPIWWADTPAILKNWIDSNFGAGFAYRYEQGGHVKKLLAGKTARIFVTSDGPSWFYRLFPVRLAWVWGLMRLGFCGVKLRSLDTLDYKRTRSEADLTMFLMRVADRARSS